MIKYLVILLILFFLNINTAIGYDGRQICIATTEIFPEARAKNKYPNYEFHDFSEGETIGYLGFVLIDHTKRKILFYSLRSEFSEFAIEYQCIDLSNTSAWDKKE